MTQVVTGFRTGAPQVAKGGGLSAIRQAILRGYLKPGQTLMESDIAEEAGKTLARQVLQVGDCIRHE